SIVPFVRHVDHTEHDVQVVVTEQGLADLRGLSPSERADLIIENCVHPDFKNQLREYVDEAKKTSKFLHTPHDFETVFSNPRTLLISNSQDLK
ncbi:MAG: propionyl-CoA--succinate CoA transferase, partial [Firmicutes bacterium HGW-Firmicutes-18]